MDTTTERTAEDTAADFFYEHAGWSYDPVTETPDEGRLRGAISMASDERWAQSVDLTFQWSDDWAVGSHVTYFGPGSAYTDPDREPEICEVCVAFLVGEVVASLGCVDEADQNYRRVIEAELAGEARWNIDNAAERALSDALLLVLT